MINFDEYRKYVVKVGKDRKRMQGKLASADFLAGAMCVYAYLDEMGKVPADWIFRTLGGEDIFEEVNK